MSENEWRAEMCPDSEPVYCEGPFDCMECDGQWSCDDIFNITNELIAEFDTNNDGLINMGDQVDDEHMGVLLEGCDEDMDG